MKLAMKASGVLQALRHKQSSQKPANRSTDGLPRYIIQDPRDSRREEHYVEITRRSSRIAAAAREGAIATSRRNRNMGHYAVNIHEDTEAVDRHAMKARKVEDHGRVRLVSDDEMSGTDDEEEESEFEETESEEEIDETVAEDMLKLEQSFKGISQKYRLINRIGEGPLFPMPSFTDILTAPRYILDRLQG